MIVRLEFSDWGTFGPQNADGQPTGSVGAFVEALLNFLIVAFAMFLVVKAYNRLKAATAEPAAEEGVSDPEDITLLREIRDALIADRST